MSQAPTPTPTPAPVSIRILGRDYTIGVAETEQQNLQAAAQLVEQHMRATRGNNRIANMERVAVLTALNLAHELLQLRKQTQLDEEESARLIAGLSHKLSRLEALKDS